LPASAKAVTIVLNLLSNSDELAQISTGASSTLSSGIVKYSASPNLLSLKQSSMYFSVDRTQ
jgi:hypothetical protein